MKTCNICSESDCKVVIPKADVTIVVKALRDQYGRRLQRIASLRDFASQVIHEVAEAGRLGDGEPHADDWEPSSHDVWDFGGPLANYNGIMRLWRAEEIGYYALIALGRAGRLLPAPAAEKVSSNGGW